MADEEQKIIVDEDWKAQVERERQDATEAVEAGGAAESEQEPEAPDEASLNTLVSMLAGQAMMALGVLTQRDATEVRVDLAEAKYLIDLLVVLREKTEGNLTPEEKGHLTQVVADLQRGYVARSQQMHEAALRSPGGGPIEAPK